VIDGSISYLYSSIPLNGRPSATASIPLRSLVRGYRDITVPPVQAESYTLLDGERKPTLLHATLALPPPSFLTAIYARRINPRTLFSLSLSSKSISSPIAGSSPPAASALAHFQHDTGRYRVEALGSTDSALLGLRGLWNFGLPTEPSAEKSRYNRQREEYAKGLGDIPTSGESTTHQFATRAKPSLLSVGAEVYYSPLSSVIGLSTGLRFTTLPPAIPISASSATASNPLAGTSAALSNSVAKSPPSTAASSFPYTMTLTLTPLTGSLASTYSIKPTQNLALSSRFGFNVYSWESEYVLGAEIWRKHRRSQNTTPSPDGLDWATEKAAQWLTDAQRLLLRQKTEEERSDENAIKVRVDDNWNIRALWTGRVKALLVSAGVSLSPTSTSSSKYQMTGPGVSGGGAGFEKRWKGSVGIEVAYSS
jgi:mitochondrial distribution and morphology protein 10